MKTGPFAITWGNAFRLAVAAAMLGCAGDAPFAITPRRALRADVLGCWKLSLAGNAGGISSPPHAPMFIRLDSTLVSDSADTGHRVLRRLSADSVPLARDADGLPLFDAWAADSTTNRLLLTFGNGHSGSRWMLEIDQDAGGVNAMHGVSTSFSDTSPDANAPRLTVNASRWCPAPT